MNYTDNDFSEFEKALRNEFANSSCCMTDDELRASARKLVSVLVKNIDATEMGLEWMEANPKKIVESTLAYRDGVKDALKLIKSSVHLGYTGRPKCKSKFGIGDKITDGFKIYNIDDIDFDTLNYLATRSDGCSGKISFFDADINYRLAEDKEDQAKQDAKPDVPETDLGKEENGKIKDNLLSELGNLHVRGLIKDDTYHKYAEWLKGIDDELERAYKNADEVQYQKGYRDGCDKHTKDNIKMLTDKVDVQEMVEDFNISSIGGLTPLRDIYRMGICDTLRRIKGESYA